jgi:hypothetical protein
MQASTVEKKTKPVNYLVDPENIEVLDEFRTSWHSITGVKPSKTECLNLIIKDGAKSVLDKYANIYASDM